MLTENVCTTVLELFREGRSMEVFPILFTHKVQQLLPIIIKCSNTSLSQWDLVVADIMYIFLVFYCITQTSYSTEINSCVWPCHTPSEATNLT